MSIQQLSSNSLNVTINDGIVTYRHNGKLRLYTVHQLIKHYNQEDVPEFVLEHPEVKQLLKQHFTVNNR